MNLRATQTQIEPAELKAGTRRLMIDAAFATIVGTLNSGVVLIAYALYLGASSAVVGLLAAMPFLTQLLQVPTVRLLERVRSRRLVSVTSLFIARLALPMMACAAIVHDRTLALVMLVLGEAINCAFNAVAGCSWNSWMRDLIPDQGMGGFFARRTLWATGLGVAGTAIAALALEIAKPGGGGSAAIFVLLYGAGFIASLFSTWQLIWVPEPRLPDKPVERSLLAMFAGTLKDVNFVRLIRFFASWQFAVNLAVPFFSVFMMQQLHFSAGFVLLMSITSQLANLLVLRGWGRLSDTFTNKTVLTFAAPAFLACIGGMALAGQIGSHAWTVVYLVVLHALMGMTSAGVSLASSAISLKLAPRGEASVYIATNALVTATAAGLAPLVAGLYADFFAKRQLRVHLDWVAPGRALDLVALSFSWWQFFFLLSCLTGLYSLHRLTLVCEQGEVPPREMLQHVINSARRGVRNASTVAGLRAAVTFPAGGLIEVWRRESTGGSAGNGKD